MTAALFALGSIVGVVLLALLALTISAPKFRIWPTPGDGSWQSYVFWPLFRSLNALAFATAIAGTPGLLELPGWFRTIAFGLLISSGAAFVYAFRLLGRNKSYCAQGGLETSGIYRWTRNPQNATLILVFTFLALAADNAATYVLCALTMAAYALMVLAEEPWLRSIYGDAYREYCRRVPRFFNWGRALQHLVPSRQGEPARVFSNVLQRKSS